MFHSEYGELSNSNLKWLSNFSGMTLLNWGFQDYQIRVIYEYLQDLEFLEEIPSYLQGSEIYRGSRLRLGAGVPVKYIYYDSNISKEDNIPQFGRREKIILSGHSRGALESWGFSDSLIAEIYRFIGPEISEGLLNYNLNWLTLSCIYRDSEYILNNYPISSRLRTNSSISNFSHANRLYPTEPVNINDDIVPSVSGSSIDGSVGSEEELLSDIYEAPLVAVRERSTETARDLTVKYLNTYGIYKDKLALITSIEEDRNTDVGYTIYIKIFNANGTTKSENIRTGISELNMSVPKLGFINHEGIAWHIERNYKKSNPEKYRRGLVSGSINILNISDSDYFVAYGIEHTYSPSIIGNKGTLQYLLYPLFFPKFFSYTEALSKINNYELLSCAITSSISIALNFKLNKIVLYKNHWAIGTYSEKNKKFIMNIDIFNSDLERAGVII